MKKKSILNQLNDLGIQEGNKSIAKFMGCTMNKETVEMFGVEFTYDQLRFHDLIGWIMPVVEYITKLKTLEKDNAYFSFQISNIVEKISTVDDIYVDKWHVLIKEVGHYGYDMGTIASANTGFLTDSLWLCIIDFINYYNTIEKI